MSLRFHTREVDIVQSAVCAPSVSFEGTHAVGWRVLSPQAPATGASDPPFQPWTLAW